MIDLDQFEKDACSCALFGVHMADVIAELRAGRKLREAVDCPFVMMTDGEWHGSVVPAIEAFDKAQQ